MSDDPNEATVPKRSPWADNLLIFAFIVGAMRLVALIVGLVLAGVHDGLHSIYSTTPSPGNHHWMTWWGFYFTLILFMYSMLAWKYHSTGHLFALMLVAIIAIFTPPILLAIPSGQCGSWIDPIGGNSLCTSDLQGYFHWAFLVVFASVALPLVILGNATFGKGSTKPEPQQDEALQ